MLNCDSYYSCCQIREYPKPARNPTGAGAGAEMNPRVCLRAGFAQPRGFACGWVFAKLTPVSAGAIPTCLEVEGEQEQVRAPRTFAMGREKIVPAINRLCPINQLNLAHKTRN